jgi:hypothetical protein
MPKIPSDEDLVGSMPAKYSTNRLKNGDAETGILNPWTGTQASIVPGGSTEKSQHAFKLDKLKGRMQQTVSAGGVQPTDFRIRGHYLPEISPSEEDPLVRAYVRATAHYADGSKDEIALPVRSVASDGAVE